MRLQCFLGVVALACCVAPNAFAKESSDASAIPKPVTDLLYARPFTLSEGYKSDWRKERPIVTKGWVLVISAPREWLKPRQTAEPVLYVGNQTAERINVGQDSGKLVILVPGDLDISKSPIWFGAPALPEQIDQKAIDEQRAAADRAGISAFPAEKVRAATNAGGARQASVDKTDLLKQLVPLIRQHAPTETELADALSRAPEATR